MRRDVQGCLIIVRCGEVGAALMARQGSDGNFKSGASCPPGRSNGVP